MTEETITRKPCKWCTYYIGIGYICQKTGKCIDIDEDFKKEYPIKNGGTK